MHEPFLDRLALRAHPRCGKSWEGMVIEEAIRQFDVLGETVYPHHYRTAGGAEVDLVLEGSFGLLAVEVKNGQRIDGHDLRGLRGFVNEQSCSLGQVVSNAPEPRLHDHRIVGIPFTHL